jgi:hypothetical protein
MQILKNSHEYHTPKSKSDKFQGSQYNAALSSTIDNTIPPFSVKGYFLSAYISSKDAKQALISASMENTYLSTNYITRYNNQLLSFLYILYR